MKQNWTGFLASGLQAFCSDDACDQLLLTCPASSHVIHPPPPSSVSATLAFLLPLEFVKLYTLP